ncbi:MAG: VOC family protein [Bacteroidetes bacterium]|nr:VOC family protein [Bacteroidales bacterium]NJO68959.1 VOC family protein [Bacteroidota bacterium]
MERHILNWFEIPVKDFERAKKFYETILDIQMPVESMDGFRMAFFPFFNGTPTGCITEGDFTLPSESHGVLIYLNGEPDLSVIIDKVEQAGGAVLTPKQLISPEYGYYGLFRDSEGNKIGLQSAG